MRSVVIASGGTGGHLYPTIAVADELRERHPDVSITFVGTSDRIESREVPKAGYPFESIVIAAPTKSLSTLLAFPFRFIWALIRSIGILRRVKADVVLGGGAYLSLPVGLAAKLLGIPLALLEINSVAGRANRWLARFAEKIFLAYPEAKSDFGGSSERVEVVGTPVRHALGSSGMSQSEAKDFFELGLDQKTILVFGGSLGAKALNEAMLASALKLREMGFNVLWQTGSAVTERLEQPPAGLGAVVKQVAYIDRMDAAYAASDLVVCRAGASSLAELSQAGKPAILVPYPFAADNHQEKNARAYETAGAAVVLRDNELREKLLDTIVQIMSSEPRRQAMSVGMRTRSNPHAAMRVADWLFKSEQEG